MRPATTNDVRVFWEEHPLFAGESSHEPGSPAFFAEHEAAALREHGGRIHPIHFRGLTPGARVLDVGCGNGFWTVQLARRGFKVTAGDLTVRALELTRQRLALEGRAATLCEFDAAALPFPDGSFDHVNCQGVLHHTLDPARCIAEFARVLTVGGTACFSVYFRSLPLRSRLLFRVVRGVAGRFMTLPGRGREGIFEISDPAAFVARYDGAGNPRGLAFTRAELLDLVRPHFTVLESARIGFPRRTLPVAMPDAVHRALSARLGLMLVLRGRRRASGGLC